TIVRPGGQDTADGTIVRLVTLHDLVGDDTTFSGNDEIHGEDGEDNSSTLTLLVKNTGQNTLQTESSSLDVLLDGQYQPDPEIEVVSGGERWSSGAVAEVTVTLDEDLESGDHRVTVIVNGNRTTFEFYHE
ncbi:MAG: hypothetical protein IH933_13040, partial [Euryarchaeota archaeon]|nr:hypothetical protein [Euryarchaeota archaeon]